MSGTNGRTPTQHVEGVVEAANANGIKLGGAWVNVSRWKPIELPAQGARIRAQIDSRGYIQSLEVLESVPNGQHAQDARERRIAKLSVLKSAAAFCASRPDLTSAQVLQVADKWLQWLEREERAGG